mmetsp:Transcript_32291/g.55104  ORF Transcript_32291/g.55104 Transcript_32291/m.55104 type:complete len:210 (+) Transcript_32291:50-679(+)
MSCSMCILCLYSELSQTFLQNQCVSNMHGLLFFCKSQKLCTRKYDRIGLVQSRWISCFLRTNYTFQFPISRPSQSRQRQLSLLHRAPPILATAMLVKVHRLPQPADRRRDPPRSAKLVRRYFERGPNPEQFPRLDVHPPPGAGGAIRAGVRAVDFRYAAPLDDEFGGVPGRSGGGGGGVLAVPFAVAESGGVLCSRCVVFVCALIVQCR